MVSVIVFSYNTKDLLAACLHAIPNSIDKLPYEIIFVDNGSIDGSAEMVKARFPKVQLVEVGANLGFSRANNTGAHISRGEALLFLNSDTVMKKFHFHPLSNPDGR